MLYVVLSQNTEYKRVLHPLSGFGVPQAQDGTSEFHASLTPQDQGAEKENFSLCRPKGDIIFS